MQILCFNNHFDRARDNLVQCGVIKSTFSKMEKHVGLCTKSAVLNELGVNSVIQNLKIIQIGPHDVKTVYQRTSSFY